MRLYINCGHARFLKDELFFFFYSYCFAKGKREPPKSSTWLEWWSLYASAVLMDWHHMFWRTTYPCSDSVRSVLSCYSTWSSVLSVLLFCVNELLTYDFLLCSETWQVRIFPDLYHLLLPIWQLWLTCRFLSFTYITSWNLVFLNFLISKSSPFLQLAWE